LGGYIAVYIKEHQEYVETLYLLQGESSVRIIGIHIYNARRGTPNRRVYEFVDETTTSVQNITKKKYTQNNSVVEKHF
jgi:hypothetical protein